MLGRQDKNIFLKITPFTGVYTFEKWLFIL